MGADAPFVESLSSLDDVREDVARWRGEETAGVCNISADFLKAGCPTITVIACGLQSRMAV